MTWLKISARVMLGFLLQLRKICDFSLVSRWMGLQLHFMRVGVVHSYPGACRFSGFERGIEGCSSSSVFSMWCTNGFYKRAVMIFWALGKGLEGGKSSEGCSFRSGGLDSPIIVGSISGMVEDMAERVKDDQEG